MAENAPSELRVFPGRGAGPQLGMPVSFEGERACRMKRKRLSRLL
jgi:hypothetical protein